jgi:hypothetical protein
MGTWQGIWSSKREPYATPGDCRRNQLAGGTRQKVTLGTSDSLSPKGMRQKGLLAFRSLNLKGPSSNAWLPCGPHTWVGILGTSAGLATGPLSSWRGSERLQEWLAGINYAVIYVCLWKWFIIPIKAGIVSGLVTVISQCLEESGTYSMCLVSTG